MTSSSKKLSLLAKKLQDFLIGKKLMDCPLLLGFSMGVDSLCLFHLLLEIQGVYPFNFAVAHVNHNWRSSAFSEAQQIKSYVSSHGVAFHLHSLDPRQMQGNLENACRQERQRFFASLIQSHDYRGVLLAHHRQDQVETLLKRLFEGSFSVGMQEEKKIGGFTCYRPLLTFKKQALQAYLKERGLKPLEDSSNHDLHFLRVRFRKQLSPLLAKTFGKGIEQNILHLAEEWEKIQDFTQSCLSPLLQADFKGPTGSFYSFNPLPHPYLLGQWLKVFIASTGMSFSRELGRQFVKAMEEKKPHQIWKIGEQTLYVDRQEIWVAQLPLSSLALPLAPESPFILKAFNKAKSLKGCWRDFLRGYFYLPEGRNIDEVMSFSHLKDQQEVKTWKRRFSKEKIPRWLWPYIPVMTSSSEACSPLLHPFRKDSSVAGQLYTFKPSPLGGKIGKVLALKDCRRVRGLSRKALP